MMNNKEGKHSFLFTYNNTALCPMCIPCSFDTTICSHCDTPNENCDGDLNNRPDWCPLKVVKDEHLTLNGRYELLPRERDNEPK